VNRMVLRLLSIPERRLWLLIISPTSAILPNKSINFCSIFSISSLSVWALGPRLCCLVNMEQQVIMLLCPYNNIYGKIGVNMRGKKFEGGVCLVEGQDGVSRKAYEGLFQGSIDVDAVAGHLLTFLDEQLDEIPYSVFDRQPGLFELPNSPDFRIRAVENQWEDVETRIGDNKKDGFKRVVRIDRSTGRQDNGLRGSRWTGYARNEVVIGSSNKGELTLEYWVGLPRRPQVVRMDFCGSGMGETAEKIAVRLAEEDRRLSPELALRHMEITSRRPAPYSQEEWRVVEDDSPKLMSPQLNEALDKIPSRRVRDEVKKKML